MNRLNDPLSPCPPIVSLLPIVYLPTYCYHHILPAYFYLLFPPIVLLLWPPAATCYPSDRRSGGSFVSPPPAVSFGTCWCLLVPADDVMWRRVAMGGLRYPVSTTSLFAFTTDSRSPGRHTIDNYWTAINQSDSSISIQGILNPL